MEVAADQIDLLHTSWRLNRHTILLLLRLRIEEFHTILSAPFLSGTGIHIQVNEGTEKDQI